MINKKSELARFIRDRGIVSKAEVIQWGMDNFYISAERAVRLLVEAGFIRKLSERECEIMNLTAKMSYYKWNDASLYSKGENVKDLFPTLEG